MLVRLHRILDHPGTNLLVASVLILSAVAEVTGELMPGVLSELQAHHGVLVFGLTQAFKAVPELAEGANKLLHGPESDLEE